MNPDNQSLLINEARILVADSDEVNLRMLEAALLDLGHRVILARNYQETLAKAKEAPDLILLGNNMPFLDRLEGVKRLKADENTGIIPIVMVTTASAGERLSALEAGVDDFLTLPLDKIELQVTVRSLLKVVFYRRQLGHYHEDVEAEVARSTESLKQSLKNLKLVSLDTIYRFSRAAEFRDEDISHGHIERMSHYSTAISRKLGLDEAFRQNILFAAPLHDIGKIAIPDKVLRKPGKLDGDEWKIVMQHTPFGAEILKDSEAVFLQMAETIAATHHEKWDGTGYPRGLKGTEIPIAGRIVAVADVFDVLTWERPYKQPVPLEKAFTIIKEGRNTHFAPDVVDAFFAIQDEIVGEFNWWKFMS